MPELDVNDIILDPDVAAEQFMVLRRREDVGDTGFKESDVVLRFTARGSVTPVGDQSLVREEAYSTQNKTIRVITNAMLRGPSKDTPPTGAVVTRYAADLIVWRGDTYVVKSLDDYSRFGRGHVEAECASFNYVNQPPSTN